MRFVAILCLCTAVVMPLAAQHDMPAPAKPAMLLEGFGDLHHPVTTSNPQAQQFFDQGLRLVYAFNHEEALRSFQRAAELDPQMAMAYWGIAEAVGPNYNDSASDERFAQAHEAAQKAMSLKGNATPAEQAYIEAIAIRFPADPKADRRAAAEKHHEAMRALMQKYPDDLDAATLFAESGMNLNPWGLWLPDGSPAAGTTEIVETLESVIRRDPNHMGAIHYYVHSTEASPSPERALAAAERLPKIAPGAGHLVHMPAHVYVRTGDYAASVATNEKAAAADEAYIKATGAQGMYPMMYYSHNLHFIAVSAAMDGDYPESKRAADELAAHSAPYVEQVPPMEGFMVVPILVDIRFHRWNDLLTMAAPDPKLQMTTFFYHVGRGMAFAGTGKLAEADAEYKIVAAAEKNMPPDIPFSMPVDNKMKDIMKIGRDVLGAKIAMARGDKPAAIAQLRAAVAVEDFLKYDEPPAWFYPVRESLGAVLLKSGNATEAEVVFREDLARNPRNPRSLYGLSQSLKAQKRDYDAYFVEERFLTSWKGGRDTLTIDDLV